MPESLVTFPEIELSDEKATITFGNHLAQHLKCGHLLFLEGELGTGKTTCVRGILQGFGWTGGVKSPTYTLVEEYSFSWGNLYHFDLYRINDSSELDNIGFREYLNENAMVIVEWGSRCQDFLPKPDVECIFSHAKNKDLNACRKVKMCAFTPCGEVIAKKMMSEYEKN